MTHYHYRLPVESETGSKLTELYAKGNESFNAASQLALELKAAEFTPSQGFAMGGIGCLLFRRKPSAKKYDVVDTIDKLYACVPNTATKEGKEILKRIAALPVVTIRQVCEAFGFDYYSDNFRGKLIPRFFRVENEWDYLQSDYPLYIEGMHPVTEEEYNQALQYADIDNVCV